MKPFRFGPSRVKDTKKPKKSITETGHSAPDPFTFSGQKKLKVSPLNNPVWRLILIIGFGSIFIAVFRQVFGASHPLSLWLLALVSLTVWVIAVRMLLLVSRLKRFWIMWLAGGLALVLSLGREPLIWLAGASFSGIFLLFRRYKPYSHLTSRRRGVLFALGIIAFIMLLMTSVPSSSEIVQDATDVEAGTAAEPGYAALLGRNLARYALVSLENFWFFSLFHLFFSVRLHFMKLRPKLAVSAIMLVLVPLTLVTVMGLLTLYGTLGESRAIRAGMILEDWRDMASVDENFIPLVCSRSFTYQDKSGQITATGDVPDWIQDFTAASRRTNFAFLDRDTSSLIDYFWVGSELWLTALTGAGSQDITIRSGHIDSAVMERLAKIMQCQVRITFSSSLVMSSEERRGIQVVSLPEEERVDLKDLIGVTPGQARAAETPLDSSRPFWKRNLYFGVSSLYVIRLTEGIFSQENILLRLEGSLLDIAGELASQRNPLSIAVLFVLLTLAVLMLVLEIFALFFGLRITTGITSAVRSLHRGTRRIARGDLETRIDIPNEDELGDLAASFNEMITAVKRGQEEAVVRERLESELMTARKIQERLLPHEMPDIPGFEIAGTSLPSQQVGGDYFDFLDMGEGQLGIAIADVSGKGIPAALLMANLQASLHAQVIKPGSVAEVTAQINERLVASSDPNMFATFIYGILDRSQSTFTATNAGHNPPILLRDNGTIDRLDSGGLVLGFLPGQEYQQRSLLLAPGDVLIMFTDGITEAVDLTQPRTEENLFGERRLIDILRRHGSDSARSIQSAILQAISEHTGHSPQSDDITLVVIKCRKRSDSDETEKPA